jgi:putative membrane protein
MPDSRVNLAKFRTQLALDRTTLAWIRTSLGLTSFGFGMVGFFRSLRQSSQTPETISLHETAIRFGLGLIVLGTVFTLLAAWSHSRALKKLRENLLLELDRWPWAVTFSLLIVLMGVAGLWYLP